MTFDGVPWAVENGANIHAGVGRVLANLATSDAEGIGLPGDMKVSPTSPSASMAVRIAGGGCVFKNPQAIGESYVGKAGARGTFTNVTIANTAGSVRHDLICAIVKDPAFAPWTTGDIPDNVNGPYFVPMVLQGVGATATKVSDVNSQYSGLALARLDIPASTTTAITSGMIVDLRALQRPRTSKTTLVSSAPVSTEGISSVGTFARWITPATFSVTSPAWATHYLASLEVTNTIHVGPNGFGVLGLFVNGTLTASNPWARLGPTGTSDRVSVQKAITNGPQTVPSPGTAQTWDLRAYKDPSSEAGTLQGDAQARAILTIDWLELAV
jgi:hypothetical protein